MTALPEPDVALLRSLLTDLLRTPSPTGYTEAAVACVETWLGAHVPEMEIHRTRKGGLMALWPGEREDAPRALTAHVDTLGAMVKEIKPNGRLKLTRVGSFPWAFVEGEGVWVHPARGGDPVPGTLLHTFASAHVYGAKAREAPRDGEHMEVRLDARVSNPDEVRALGIEVGDFVSFEPRVEWHEGFVRSRHLDDKAGVASVMMAFQALSAAGMRPRQTTYLLVSNYEEVGHGAAAGWPPEVVELVAVDMAAVGTGQTSDEFHATLCLKDSGGPYHHGLSQRLRQLAAAHGIPYKLDVYPYYGSDGEAAWRAGADLAVALIGPGVDASHNYERTHMEALLATTRWVEAYLLSA